MLRVLHTCNVSRRVYEHGGRAGPSDATNAGFRGHGVRRGLWWGWEGGGGTITGRACALIALFGLKTYVVKHILKFNISLKSEQGYQRARARKRGVKLSEGVRKRTWFSS